MLTHVLKSTIHRGRVTAGNAHDEGRLGMSRDFMDKLDLVPCERIL
jgi:aspartate 1-decarboxylase